MSKRIVINPDSHTRFKIKRELGASLSVFFVALPLCLGIAVASGAPPESGLIAGIIGGILVGLASGSQTSVSGPAAGMVAVVLASMGDLGSFASFCQALFLAGLIQFVFGLAQVGFVAKFIPKNIIQGLMVSIGIILILKQIPNALGLNEDYFGDFSFSQINGRNTFSEIWKAIKSLHFLSVLIFGISIFISLLWEKKDLFAKWNIPSSLVVVAFGMAVQFLLLSLFPGYSFQTFQLVQIPEFSSISFLLPNIETFQDEKVWKAAITISLVASLETLLNLKATDNLDPFSRISPPNRELMAQGAGNLISGLVGGIPITSVVVRSSVNIQSGATNRWSAIFHGIWLLISMFFLFPALNLIPLCSLASLLIIGGYKLTRFDFFVKMYQRGMTKFIPFILTIVAIVFTDLLIGILLGWIAHGIIGRIKLKTIERKIKSKTLRNTQYL